MASTPLPVIEAAYETNFGGADETLPLDEVIIEHQRRHMYEGRALIEAITCRDLVGWEEMRTALTNARLSIPVRFGVSDTSHYSAQIVLWVADELASTITDEPQTIVDEELRSQFGRLSRQWHEETDFLSSPSDIVLNFNYQRIIGIGPAALPLIIEELRVRGGRWFWALRAITGIDPTDTADQGNATKMKGAWLRWWEQTE